TTNRAGGGEDFFSLQFGSTGQSLRKVWNSVARLVILSWIVQRRKQFYISLRWFLDVVVEAGNQNPLIRTFQRVQCPDESPCRVREDRTAKSRMHIRGQQINGKFHITDSTKSKVL